LDFKSRNKQATIVQDIVMNIYSHVTIL
jgi:hypothetical protein